MENVNYVKINMVEVEKQARQMRAEAVAYGVGQVRAWIKNLFAGRTLGVKAAA